VDNRFAVSSMQSVISGSCRRSSLQSKMIAASRPFEQN
jgi:hypothetical protein